MTAVPVVNAGTVDILSPSQVKTFLSCAAKWMFHYVLGLKEPKTGLWRPVRRAVITRAAVAHCRPLPPASLPIFPHCVKRETVVQSTCDSIISGQGDRVAHLLPLGQYRRLEVEIVDYH